MSNKLTKKLNKKTFCYSNFHLCEMYKLSLVHITSANRASIPLYLSIGSSVFFTVKILVLHLKSVNTLWKTVRTCKHLSRCSWNWDIKIFLISDPNPEISFRSVYVKFPCLSSKQKSGCFCAPLSVSSSIRARTREIAFQ